ncbi:MAG: LPXTG cell wall anchor domain-containing protein [Actinomycetota bacterium]|nr:LPXTG cell wall anchor domain-containing protein [Actinomycetota bacterium]
MSCRKLGLLALVIGAAVIWALPAVTLGQSNDLKGADSALKKATQQVGGGVQKTVTRTTQAVKQAKSRLGHKLVQTTNRAHKTRATATDPQVQPPEHGTNPRGQGTTGVVDLTPSAERPFGDSTDQGVNTGEEIIGGRARGEQNADGTYHGHITIAQLGTSELLGVDSTPGQTNHGPLEPLQTGLLNQLCTGTGGPMVGICLTVLMADSSTTATGSTNRFAVATASLGTLRVGAAESQGNISNDANCQTGQGTARTANITSGTGVVAAAGNSASTSVACRGQAEKTTQSSQVLQLGGTGVTIPAPGCENGTPDTRFQSLAPLATIVCNAEELTGSGVRHALDVFALSTGTTSLAQESTAQSESHAVAPPAPPTPQPQPKPKPKPNNKGETGKPQCSDNKDNDGDGLVDEGDPGCHTGNNINNPYNPNDDNEANGGGGGAGGGRAAQCSDGVDNDGDRLVDFGNDPGCSSRSDDSEAGGARNAGAGRLPFTGTDVLGLGVAGLLLLAGGLLLRRREDLLPE